MTTTTHKTIPPLAVLNEHFILKGNGSLIKRKTGEVAPPVGADGRQATVWVPGLPKDENNLLVSRIVFTMQNGAPPTNEVLHLDDNPANNSAQNLVDGTSRENSVQRGQNNGTAREATGVDQKENGRWRWTIYLGGHKVIGMADTKQQAIGLRAAELARYEADPAGYQPPKRISKVGVPNVQETAEGKFIARLTHKKVGYCLGTFDTIDEAIDAVIAKKLELGIEVKYEKYGR